jgi:hypothetical protein
MLAAIAPSISPASAASRICPLQPAGRCLPPLSTLPSWSRCATADWDSARSPPFLPLAPEFVPCCGVSTDLTSPTVTLFVVLPTNKPVIHLSYRYRALESSSGNPKRAVMQAQDRCDPPEPRGMAAPMANATRLVAAAIAEVLTQAPRGCVRWQTRQSDQHRQFAANVRSGNQHHGGQYALSHRSASDCVGRSTGTAASRPTCSGSRTRRRGPKALEGLETDLLSPCARPVRIRRAGGNLLIRQIAESRRLLVDNNREQEARLIEATELSIAHARH